MKAVLINYNFTPTWLKDSGLDYVLYDRSDSKKWLKDIPKDRVIYTKNIGSDWYDKFGWIIDNYDSLPDVILLSKSNIFKYITKKEFKEVRDSETFTPLLTKNHKPKMCHWNSMKPFSFYKDGIYWEINGQVQWLHNTRCNPHKLMEILGIRDMKYTPFAPGSSYIVPRECILKYPKRTYEILRESIAYDVYPPEAMIIERGMYTFWR